MESLISTFHIDVKLLIAQIVNFSIVFAVLYFFALKPITKIMKDREKTIEKGLENAKKIEEKMMQVNQDSHKIIEDTKKEAYNILKEADEKAEARRLASIEKTRTEIGELINKEKENMRREKDIVLKEIKRDITKLVILTTEKVLGEKVDSEKDTNIIKKAIKENKKVKI